jgi:hypothetical protein
VKELPLSGKSQLLKQLWTIEIIALEEKNNYIPKLPNGTNFSVGNKG